MSHPTQVRRTGFREDIQGMRALAVLAIIVYHVEWSPYPGGFVTLDVFFVVSGFLITFLLLKEIARDGTVSLTGFYARRARRILPAATFVTLVTVAASWVWLNVVEAQDAAYDAVWAALFGANVRFAMEETDYFAQETAPSPLQHYWSLSVEEQFYLALPLLLVACVLWAGRRRTTGNPRRTIAVAVGAVTVVSFAWSVHASHASPETAYFSTFTRTWEFGVGALLALLAAHCAGLTDRFRNLLAGTGLAAIVVACFVTTEQTPFPGYAALLPVLGTGAVMIAGAGVSGRPPLVQRALGIAPLRWVGDASYSLYLWHWPVLVIAVQHAGRPLRVWETAVLIVVVFALSWWSHRFVETPFRRISPTPMSRALLLYPASVLVVVVGCVASVTWLQHEIDADDTPAISVSDFEEAPSGGPLAEDPAVALVQASARAAQEGTKVPGNLSPSLLELQDDEVDLGRCENTDPPWRRCRQGDRDGERTLALLGNSHGRHWIPALERIAEESGFRAYYLVKPACTPVRVQTVRRDEHWEECTDFNAWAEDQLEELQPDLLVVAGSAPPAVMVDGEPTSEFDELLPAMRQGWTDLLEDVSVHAARTVVLGDTPRRSTQPAECLGSRDPELADCLDEPRGRSGEVTRASREAADEVGVDFVDTLPWFCADGLCPAVVGSTITMRDQGHITTAYAEQLAAPLARALGVGPSDG